MFGQINVSVVEYSMVNGTLDTGDIVLNNHTTWRRLDLESTEACTVTLKPYTVGGVLADSLIDSAGNPVTFTAIVGTQCFIIPKEVSDALRGRKFQLVADALTGANECKAYIQSIANNAIR